MIAAAHRCAAGIVRLPQTSGSAKPGPSSAGSWYLAVASATEASEPGKIASSCSHPAANATPGPQLSRRYA